MADLRRLLDILTGFQGRINRAKWWLGLLVIGIASVLGGLILNPEFFPSEVAQPSWPDTLWQIALIYPGTAITVKRFNDTGRPGWLGYLFAPLSALLLLKTHFIETLATIDPAVRLTVALPMFAYFLFAFIDNGFVRGTDGPNQFGPDPLAGKAA